MMEVGIAISRTDLTELGSVGIRLMTDARADSEARKDEASAALVG